MVLFIRYKEDLVALVVDEAHCVKLWGERTAFSELGTLRSLIPSEVNILALTATATTETYHSVTSSLLMKDVQLISSPPSRDNLIYFLKPKHNLDELVSVLSSEFTNPAVQKIRRLYCLLEDMVTIPTSIIYHWKQNLETNLQTLLDTQILLNFEG